MEYVLQLINRLYAVFRDVLDKLYFKFDRRNIRTARNIYKIPRYPRRSEGRRSYAEWGHAIGIFETLIKLTVDQDSTPLIVDIGCGHGFLAVACEPLIHAGAAYIGIDVKKDNIEFCQHHFEHPRYQFLHLNIHNTLYSNQQPDTLVAWAVDDGVVDLVTALSVWTHLLEKDARYYFKEINRVLRPGGKAIITFFLLDEYYDKWLSEDHTKSPYHSTNPEFWVFSEPLPKTGEWYHPSWVKTPEIAIGVSRRGLDLMLEDTDLQLQTLYPGNWKNLPGIYFQDIVILEKRTK